MELKNKLLNHWIEYEGGRLPNSNLLQFVEVDEQMIRFELRYVFDGSEDDIVNLGIDVPQEMFNKMIDDIETNGIATLDIDQKNSSLSSDWRMNDGDLEIRLSFSGTTLSGSDKVLLVGIYKSSCLGFIDLYQKLGGIIKITTIHKINKITTGTV